MLGANLEQKQGRERGLRMIRSTHCRSKAVEAGLQGICLISRNKLLFLMDCKLKFLEESKK